MSLTSEAIRLAQARLAPYMRRTPVITSRAINACCGARVHFKCENLQHVGAFKFRGAMNALLQLGEDERRRGVVTHSSGNHGQALAKAARILGVPAWVVMPRTAAAIKRDATEGYGATVVACEPTLADRESTVQRLVDSQGLTLIHPFNDWRVIAGQGTAALEFFDQVNGEPLDILLTPCGGGGLLAGSALAASSRSPTTKVVGVEPANADDARRSLAAGQIMPSGDPATIADGLRTSLGEKTFSIIQERVHSIVSATEAEIVAAMRFFWERTKLIIEPSAAVPVAALFNGQLSLEGKNVGVILSGGNVDVEPFFSHLASRWLVPNAAK